MLCSVITYIRLSFVPKFPLSSFQWSGRLGGGPGNKAEGVQDGCTWLHAAICMGGWPIFCSRLYLHVNGLKNVPRALYMGLFIPEGS